MSNQTKLLENEQTALLEQRYGCGVNDTLLNAPWTPTISQLLRHVSVRFFLPDPLPPGTLEILTAAAQSTSTGTMLQSWSAIAVTDPVRKDRVATLSGGQDFIRQAPLFLIFCADLSRLAAAAEHHGHPGGAEGLTRVDLFIMATLDAAMAAQNACVAAESLGLGMCYVGGARNNARELTEYLGLPPRVIGLFGMAVGRPDPRFLNTAKPRLPMDAVLHREVWDSSERHAHAAEYEECLTEYYKRQQKGDRKPWTVQLAHFVASGDLDGRGRMRGVLDDQGFEFS